VTKQRRELRANFPAAGLAAGFSAYFPSNTLLQFVDGEAIAKKDDMKEYADRMRAPAHSKVDDLGVVQCVCGSPEVEHPGTAHEG
jgi:hypothetical protein